MLPGLTFSHEAVQMCSQLGYVWPYEQFTCPLAIRGLDSQASFLSCFVTL